MGLLDYSARGRVISPPHCTFGSESRPEWWPEGWPWPPEPEEPVKILAPPPIHAWPRLPPDHPYDVPPGYSAPNNLPTGHPGAYYPDMPPDPVFYRADDDTCCTSAVLDFFVDDFLVTVDRQVVTLLHDVRLWHAKTLRRPVTEALRAPAASALRLTDFIPLLQNVPRRSLTKNRKLVFENTAVSSIYICMFGGDTNASVSPMKTVSIDSSPTDLFTGRLG